MTFFLTTGYDVKNFYKTTGWAQRIARHHIFENITMAIIIIYAVYMSIDADFNEATIITETNPFFIVSEQPGTSLYRVEAKAVLLLLLLLRALHPPLS